MMLYYSYSYLYIHTLYIIYRKFDCIFAIWYNTSWQGVSKDYTWEDVADLGLRDLARCFFQKNNSSNGEEYPKIISLTYIYYYV